MYSPHYSYFVIIHHITWFSCIGIISCPTCTCQPAPLLAGIVPTVVLLLANVLTGVGVFLITRHCYKKTSQKSSSKGKTSEPDTYEDIVMTDSPAYGPVN